MAASSYGLVDLTTLQLGLETDKGTLVAATHQWLGKALWKPETKIIVPRYPRGIPGGTVPEDSYVGDTGTTIEFQDFPWSVEQAAYLLNMAIKKVLASAGTTPWLLDNFALPVDNTTLNDIATFTLEWSDGIQEYEAGYGFCEKFSIHADENANDGVVQGNATLRARASTPSTLTPGLAAIANILPFKVAACTIKVNALGTAAGTASATLDWLKAFNIDVVTGWGPDRSLSGRADGDFGSAIYNGQHKVSGKFEVLMTAPTVTQIANAKAGTGIVVQVGMTGTGTRAFKANLPIVFTKDPELGGADREGKRLVTLEWEAGYSTTSTAQGISFPTNMSASTTIT